MASKFAAARGTRLPHIVLRCSRRGRRGRRGGGDGGGGGEGGGYSYISSTLQCTRANSDLHVDNRSKHTSVTVQQKGCLLPKHSHRHRRAPSGRQPAAAQKRTTAQCLQGVFYYYVAPTQYLLSSSLCVATGLPNLYYLV